jgi:hypothetical protein
MKDRISEFAGAKAHRRLNHASPPVDFAQMFTRLAPASLP